MFNNYDGKIKDLDERLGKLEKKMDDIRSENTDDYTYKRWLEEQANLSSVVKNFEFSSLFQDVHSVTSLIFRDEKGLYRIDTSLPKDSVNKIINDKLTRKKGIWKGIPAIATKSPSVIKSFGPYHPSTVKKIVWQNEYFYDKSVIEYSINKIWIADELVNVIAIDNFKSVDQSGMDALTGVSRTFNGPKQDD